jgi:hypothetical protein
MMHDIFTDALAYLIPPVPTTTVNPHDPATWTLARTAVPGVGEVSTAWHPIRFAPAYGVDGPAQHYESLTRGTDGAYMDSQTYTTEQEARDGHARRVAALRRIAGTL